MGRQGKKPNLSRTATRNSVRLLLIALAIVGVAVVCFSSLTSGTYGAGGIALRQLRNIGSLAGGKGKKIRIGILSTYIPQKCGIAEFSYEILKAMRVATNSDGSPKDIEIGVIVMNNDEYIETGYENGASLVIRRNVLEDFFIAADFANANFDIILCEHEFGMYGGYIGDYLFAFLNRLDIPFVVTLHTILSRLDVRFLDLNLFDEHMGELFKKASWVTVALGSVCFELEEISPGVSKKCSHIPHGIPNFSPNISAVQHKYGHLIQNKLVVLTAGLIGPSKGINFMIEAMREVSQEFPEATYFIVGQEHPLAHLNYHETLRRLVEANGVSSNVQFVVEFMSKRDLEAWISLADVVVLPYVDPGQVSSGSLSMAMGLGRPVVSSRFKHAIHMCLLDNLTKQAWDIEAEAILSGKITSKKGLEGHYCRLVDIKSSEQLAATVSDLLKDKAGRTAMGQLAKQRTQGMSWFDISDKLLAICDTVIAQHVTAEALPAVPLRLSQGPSDKLHALETLLRAIQRTEPRVQSVDVGLLRRYFRGQLAPLAARAVLSLTHSGMLFAAWRPPSAKFRFNLNKNGIFVLRDSVKTVHGFLKDGAVFMSHAEHGLVFGRGNALSWPFLDISIPGLDCSSIDQRRNLTWGHKVNDTAAELWTTTVVTCIVADIPVPMAHLTNRITARVNERFVRRSVRVRFPKTDFIVPSIRVMTRFFQLSSQYSSVYYSHFHALQRNGQVPVVHITHTDFDVYRPAKDSRLAMYLLTNKEGKSGVFMKPLTEPHLDGIYSWNNDGKNVNKKSMVEDLEHRYFFNASGRTDFHVNELVVLLGRVDPAKLPVYVHLFEEEQYWPGVDFSLAENVEEIRDAMAGYAASLGKSSSERREVERWLKQV